MIWRSFRLSHLPSRSRITNPLAAVHSRHSSALHRTKSNVATILATPPPTGEHLITVAGSVRTVRNQKHRSFVELGDGSTTHSLQAVLEPAQAEGYATHAGASCAGRATLTDLIFSAWEQVLPWRSLVCGDLPLREKNRDTSSRPRMSGSLERRMQRWAIAPVEISGDCM